MKSDTILGLLVCPVTKLNLLPLTNAKAKPLYRALSKGELLTIDGSSVEADEKLVQFMMTENTRHIYSIIDGTPILLEAKQIDFKL